MRRIDWTLVLMVGLGCGPGLVSGGGETHDSTMTTTSSTSADTETGEGDEPMQQLEACALVRVEGDARVPIDPDSSSSARLTTLHPGDARTSARVMLTQYETFGEWHSNHRARSFVIAPPWPEGVVETEPSLPLTRSGHYMSRLVKLPDAQHRFAYVWNGDPDGLNDYDTFFSIVDADPWTVNGEIEIESSTNPSFVDLLQTPSTERFVITYTSADYDAPPTDDISGFSLGILDADGTPLVGATELIASTPEPGSAVRTFWAGDRVATAIGHNDCYVDDNLCFPHAVVLARPIAPDEHGAAVDGFEVAHVIDGLASTQHVSRPQVFVEHGFTWLTWYEGDDWVAVDEHRTFRALVLDEGGDPIPWPPDAPGSGPISFVADTAMDRWPVLLVSEFGVTVAFRTADGFFEVRHHDFAFAPLGEPILIELDSTEANYPAMTTLADPRSMLLAWGEEVEAQILVRMVRLECA
jgi:hypothetical protein